MQRGERQPWARTRWRRVTDLLLSLSLGEEVSVADVVDVNVLDKPANRNMRHQPSAISHHSIETHCGAVCCSLWVSGLARAGDVGLGRGSLVRVVPGKLGSNLG